MRDGKQRGRASLLAALALICVLGLPGAARAEENVFFAASNDTAWNETALNETALRDDAMPSEEPSIPPERTEGEPAVKPSAPPEGTEGEPTVEPSAPPEGTAGEPSIPPEGTTGEPTEPSAGTQNETPPEIESSADLFLCLRAGEDVSDLLDVLDEAGVRAAFFCDRAFLEQQGDMVRRMAASGHSVGLYLYGADGLRDGELDTPEDGTREEATPEAETREESTPEAGTGESITPEPGATESIAPEGGTGENRNISLQEQAAECQSLLERAVCMRTRLAWVENGTDGDRAVLRTLGVVCLEASLDRAEDPPRSTSRRESLLREAEELGGRASVWLGDGLDAEDMERLLNAVHRAGGRCLPLTETSFPLTETSFPPTETSFFPTETVFPPSETSVP